MLSDLLASITVATHQMNECCRYTGACHLTHSSHSHICYKGPQIILRFIHTEDSNESVCHNVVKLLLPCTT
jgi:hypothetical protein